MPKSRPQRRIDKTGDSGSRTITITGGSGTGGGLTAHGMASSYHTGTLAESQAPWAVTQTEFDTHTADADAHHNRLHDILGVNDHEITAAAYTLIGATLTDTLGKLYISSSGDGIDVTKSGGNFTIAVDVSDFSGDGLGDDGSNNLYVRTAEGITTHLDNVIVDETYDFAWTGDHTHTETVGSASFTSGFAGSGWRIDTDNASLELNDLTVRGRLSVYELLIRQIRATNGNVFVSDSAKVTSVSGSGPYTLSVDTGDVHGFAVGDLIRAQRFTGTGTYQVNMQVTSVTDTKTFLATLTSGDAPASDMEFVRLGSATDADRRGSIYLAASDTYAPFIDIIDGVDAFTDWNTADVLKVRIGNLDGVTDPILGVLSGYGLYVKGGGYFNGEVVAGSGEIALTSGGLELDANSQAGTNWILFTTSVGDGYDPTKLAGYISGYRYVDAGDTKTLTQLISKSNATWATDESEIEISAQGEDGATAAIDLLTTYNTGTVTITAWDEQSPTVLGDILLRGNVQVVLGDVLPTGTQNLGSATYKWDKIYVNELIAGTTSSIDTGHNHDDRYYLESEVDSLLSGKSDTTHTHTGYVLTSTYTTGLATKADASHTHDDRYYTESEVNALIAGVSTTGHTHDDRYYTESEVDALIVNFVTSAGLTTTLGDYVTSASLTTTLGDYVTSTGLSTTLADYYSEAEVDAILGGYSLTSHSHTSLPLTEITYGGSATINIGTDGTLTSSNYVSGRTGYSLGPDGLEASNADIRGVIRSGMLQSQGTLWSYGSQIFGPSAKVREELTITAPGTQTTLAVDDADIGHVQVFSVGEILKIKGPAYIVPATSSDNSTVEPWLTFVMPTAVLSSSEVMAEVWLEVDSVSDETTHWEYTCTVRYGPRSVFSAGAIVGSYGTSTTGRISITSDALYAPYMDVFTTGETPWQAVTSHLRIGKLNGLAVGASGRVGFEYGMATASDLSDATQPWMIASNQRLAMNNVSQTITDSDGDTALMLSPDTGLTLYYDVETVITSIDDDRRVSWIDPDDSELYFFVGPDDYIAQALGIRARPLGRSDNDSTAIHIWAGPDSTNFASGSEFTEPRYAGIQIFSYDETSYYTDDDDDELVIETVYQSSEMNLISAEIALWGDTTVRGDLVWRNFVTSTDDTTYGDIDSGNLNLRYGQIYVDADGFLKIRTES